MDDQTAVIFKLVEYEVWSSLQAVTFLERLPHEACSRDFGFGWGTPHRTIFHIAEVMQAWSRCVGPIIKEPVWLDYDETTTLEAIETRIRETGKFWLAEVRASAQLGVLAEDRRLHQVFHIVTHGMHHRAELFSMFTLMGYNEPFEGGDFGGWTNDTSDKNT